MAQLSIDEIIELGDISTSLSLNYQANGALFGPRKTYTAATTIATVTDALRWQWAGFPDITAITATATLEVLDIGNPSDQIYVYVDDPVYGQILIGSYTQLITDNTTQDLADGISASIASNPYGYKSSSALYPSSVVIFAPEGYGSSINGAAVTVDLQPPCDITASNFASGVDGYTNIGARGVANYLYWLCGKFALEGQYIITGTGGGSVVPINPGATPNPIEFEVTGSSFIPDGDSTVSIPSFVGYNLLFVRNNVPQSIINTGASYFSWNKVTGVFTCSPAAVSGELFQLYPFI